MTSFSIEQAQVLATAFAVEVDETRSHLTKAILRLERGREDNRPVLFAILTRGLHTLKGSAASIGMNDVSYVVHALEDVIAPAVAARTALASGLATLLLEGLDAVHDVVSARARGVDTGIDVAEWRRRTGGAAGHQVPDPPVSVPSLPDESREPDGIEWRISEADVRGLESEASRLNDLAAVLRERADRASAASEAVSERDLEARERLRELARVLLLDATGLEALTSTFEHRIAALSCVRAGLVVEPLRRLARDQAAAHGKRVTLEVAGEDLTVSRLMAQGLRGVLVHLVNNAIAHGIEPIAIRRQRGKEVEGRLGVTFERSADRLRVAVEDDGAGLDVERIREAAIRVGFVSSEEAMALAEPELLAFVFKPGFTTNGSVTVAAGRGIGLDAVEATVRGLGGTVSVKTTAGAGARFVLDLPERTSPWPKKNAAAGLGG